MDFSNVFSDRWTDDLQFHVLSTVFQSFQDDERVKMKGCLQWDAIYA